MIGLGSDNYESEKSTSHFSYLAHLSHSHSGVDRVHSDLVWAKLEGGYPEEQLQRHTFACAHLLGHHVQGSFGGAVHRVVPKSGLRGLRAHVDDGSWLLVRHHLANDQLSHVDHLLHIGVEQPEKDVGYSWAGLATTHKSISAGVTSRKGVQIATAALFTNPSIRGRGDRADLDNDEI